MRRKDREMGVEFGLEVIDRSDFGVLSLVDLQGQVYSVPLSIARDGMRLYFHSARSGFKNTLLKEGKKVRIVFVSDVRVPDLFENSQLDQVLAEEKGMEMLGSKVFTTEFASAIVTGKVAFEESEEGKLRGLRAICEKFVPGKMAYFEAAASNALSITSVYSIDIEEITAKRKKFDSMGEEMKFQRME
ncbi:MAG TPA: 5-nitroimidazole antibiotic resistance protein [Anaerolineaceae bacterium]|jgi:nitroimidazol reductase NimA-like FMN-containing flavoprotein (pyridoxamine 5'-phosphate oxidase superfamily)|nr:5-nitroimidazole antibiotic resistance protein [Anaerolineaceae bacterium]